MIGFVWGTTAALAGGIADSILMRIVDVLLALPRLLIAIIVLVALRLDASTVPGLVFALAVAGWMLTARLVRGHMLGLKTRGFVKASRALGAGWARVARRHLLPNSTGILLVALLLGCRPGSFSARRSSPCLDSARSRRRQPGATSRTTAGPPDGCGT